MSMSLEAALTSMRRELVGLQDAVAALRVTVVEDVPAGDAVVLVDRVENLVTELTGALEEAEARTAGALQASEELEGVRGALGDVHALLNRCAVSHIGELAAHDHLARLLAMGRERGREWREWTQEVKTAIERCPRPMSAVMAVLVECWKELADCLARGTVSVRATNIGQQIAIRENQWETADKVT
jgi:hypothetical protein